MSVDILASLDERIALVRRELRGLEEARSALTGDPPGPGTSSRQLTVARSRTSDAADIPRVDQAPRDGMLILRAVKASGEQGISGRNAARQTSLPHSRSLQILRGLEEGGMVRRSGTGRGTRWHMATPAPAAASVHLGD